MLGMRRGVHAWVREVEMRAKNKPWMLARVIFPQDTLRHAGHPNIIGSAPIGHALFKDNRTERSHFEVAQLYGEHPPLSPVLKWDKTVWGRRSIFFIGGWPLLLSEAFLPIFQEHLESGS
jgi:chorismate--pyruvate lyase